MVAQYRRDYAGWGPESWLAIRNNLVLLAVLCFTLIACGGPDYSKPASEGEKPSKDVVPGYSITINTPPPNPWVCDTAYKIRAKITESGVKVKCASYDYKDLFKLATSLLASEVKSLSPSCPKNCSPLQQINSAMTWTCSEMEVGNGTATLILQVTLICPTKGKELPKEKDHQPSAEELKQKDFLFNPDGDDLNKETDEMITRNPRASRPCPGKEVFKVVYKEVVPNFATLINAADCSSAAKQPFYKTYAQKGKDLAKDYFNSFTCDSGCDKAPFEVVYQKWDCDTMDKAVVVETFFNVDCILKK